MCVAKGNCVGEKDRRLGGSRSTVALSKGHEGTGGTL